MLKIKKSITGMYWAIVWEHTDGSSTILCTRDRKWQAEQEKSRLERSVVFNI